MAQNSNSLDFILALLTPLIPSLAMILYRNRKYILKFLQTVTDFAKRGEDEDKTEADDAAIDARIADYMAYAGSIEKQVGLVAQAQSRSDAATQRIENAMIGMETRLTDKIEDIDRRHRVRLDSQLQNDFSLHRRQNERLQEHEDGIAANQTEIIDLKRRMDIADDYLKSLRHDLDDCLKKGA